MPVHVDEIVSNVFPEPEASAQPSADDPEWRRAAAMREMHARQVRDRWRTAAEGFDD